jgi:hypothetical protein
MPPENMRCPECKGEMEKGFIPDYAHSGMFIQRWVKGAPRKSWWRGLFYEKEDSRFVETYRCCGCGYLKSYAIELAGWPRFGKR